MEYAPQKYFWALSAVPLFLGLTFSPPANGQPYAKAGSALAGRTSVDISVTTDDDSDSAACKVNSREAFRSALNDEFASAGLKVSDDAVWTVSFRMTTLHRDGKCSTALVGENRVYGKLKLGGLEQDFFDFITVSSRLSVFTSTPNNHFNLVRDSVVDLGKEMLVVWREANPAPARVATPAARSRSAPAAEPPPATLARPQSLDSTPTAPHPAVAARDHVLTGPAWFGAAFDMPSGVMQIWIDRVESKGGRGALVTRIEANSPAAKAGLRRGDVVHSVDGKKIEIYSDLDRLIADTRAGKTLKLVVYRFPKPEDQLNLDSSDKPTRMPFDVTLMTKSAEQTASGRTLRGYVALGDGVAGAKVCAKPDADDRLPALDNRLDCTITDARGGFLFENVRDKLKYVAEFEEYVREAPDRLKAGVEKRVRKLRRLFSTDTGEENMQINPVTDLIVRTAAYQSTGRHDDESVWKAPPVSAGVLERISRSVAGILNLKSRAPLTDPDFVPDPTASSYDATLESSKISIENGKVLVANVNGKVMTTAPLEAVAGGTARAVPFSESLEASNLAFDKRKNDIRDLYGEIRVTPEIVKVNETVTYTVKGRHLIDDMSFDLKGCEGARELPGGSATERRFSCRLASPGTTTGNFRFMAGGTSLKIFFVEARKPEEMAPSAQARPALAPTPQAQRPAESGSSGKQDSTDSAAEVLSAIGTILSIIDTVQKIQDATQTNNTPSAPTNSPQPRASSQAPDGVTPNNSSRPAPRTYCNDGSGRSYLRGVDQAPSGCHCLANIGSSGVTCR